MYGVHISFLKSESFPDYEATDSCAVISNTCVHGQTIKP